MTRSATDIGVSGMAAPIWAVVATTLLGLTAACALGAELPVTLAPGPVGPVRLRLVHAYAAAGHVTVTGEALGRSGPVIVTATAEGCRDVAIALWIPYPPRSQASAFSGVLSCSGAGRPGAVTLSLRVR